MAGLSAKSIAVLELIAAGHSYEQILSVYPDLTYVDIFHAAQESLDCAAATENGSPATSAMARVKERHARAYERWDDAEDDRLRALVASGETVARIAGQLQRQRSAIRSRILKLDLVSRLNQKERLRYDHARRMDVHNPASADDERG